MSARSVSDPVKGRPVAVQRRPGEGQILAIVLFVAAFAAVLGLSVLPHGGFVTPAGQHSTR